MAGESSVDVIVVGFGVAGLSTAISASEDGARVLILEKMPQRESGGSSRVSGLQWFSPTSVEGAERYLRNLCGPYELPDALVKTWASEVAKNTEWLSGLGVKSATRDAEPEFPEIDGHDCEPGWFYTLPGPGDSRLWTLLREEALRRGVEVSYETRALELIQDGGQGEVTGVLAGQPGGPVRLDARRGVALASGGFTNDPQLARDFLRLPSIHPRGSPASTGDGLRMAQKAGAALWHMHNFCGAFGLKAPEFAAGFEVTMPADGWIYVDTAGRRLIDESIPWRHGKVRKGDGFTIFPDRVFHCIFDEATRLAGPLWQMVEQGKRAWNRMVEPYIWSYDNSDEVERGWITTGSTLRQLASRLGLDPDALERTVQRYNDACSGGFDGEFERDPRTLVPVLRPPFYAWTWGPLATYTCGGPVKDERARVLDPRGVRIPRLYAAGEVSSTYSWVNSGGTMIGDAMAFGRLAGKGAAGETPRV